jgi:amino acid transporter
VSGPPGESAERSILKGEGSDDNAPVKLARKAQHLTLLSLVCVMYLVVSGGAYGLEDSVGIAGPRLALLLCLVVPLTLSLPTALMAAELTALMPVEGGFYFWVKEALGPFAGFVEAYLTILYTAVDTAIYPALFTTYLAFVIPLGASWQIILGIALVWLAGILNIMGVRPVGNASVVLSAILIAPFAALVIAGLPHLIHWQMPAQPLAGKDFLGALGGGLTIVIWNFSGWENLSVVAAEIRDPTRNYLRAIAIALPLVVLGYVLPLGVSLSGATGVAQWHTGWFAEEGRRLGGPPLEIAIGIGGAVSAFAVLEAAMLWVSRLPFVLAREHYLPHQLALIWSDRATPVRSILLCCVVFTLLVPLGFVTLVVLDVFFYMFALMLEMAALIRLRRTRPHRAGLFVIGGGRAVLCAVAMAPILTWIATFGLAASESGGKLDFIVAVALTASVWPVYAILRHYFGGPKRIL